MSELWRRLRLLFWKPGLGRISRIDLAAICCAQLELPIAVNGDIVNTYGRGEPTPGRKRIVCALESSLISSRPSSLWWPP